MATRSSNISVLPTTDITAFISSFLAPSQDCLGENAREWAVRVVPHFSAENLIQGLLSLIPIVGVIYGRQFLIQAVLCEKLSKDTLRDLYILQRDAVFGEHPFVTLEFLARLVTSGGQVIFSREEILLLEEERHTGKNDITMRYIPCITDLSYLLCDEVNRKVLKTATLRRWGQNLRAEDMNMSAIIDVELVRRKESKMSKQDIGCRLALAAETDPTGNAVRAYLGLLLSRARRKSSVREEILRVLREMLSPAERRGKIDFTAAQGIFQFYISNPLIPDEDRAWLTSEVTRNCQEFAQHYLSFAGQAKERDPFRIKRK